MKSKTIGYSESKEFVDYSTGLKTWRKVWYEIEPDDDGIFNVNERFGQVKQKVQEWLNQDKPQGETGYIDNGKVVLYDQPIPPDQQSQGLIQVIEMCDTVQKLERFWGQVTRSKSGEVAEAYNNKLKSLQK